jgi:hypothetical protein
MAFVVVVKQNNCPSFIYKANLDCHRHNFYSTIYNLSNTYEPTYINLSIKLLRKKE